MQPFILFAIQFTVSLAAFALIGAWYVTPRLAALPREAAVVPLLWVHAFRVVGGVVLAPGAVGAGVPDDFRTMVGVGDIVTAVLALAALVALRSRRPWAIGMVWIVLVVGAVDTVNAVIQSTRYEVFAQPLGVNWVIVTTYVPALVVSSVLILVQLRRRDRSPAAAGQ